MRMNEKETRCTTAHVRYHVTCGECGVIGFAQSRLDAIKKAGSQIARCHRDGDECARITQPEVFDSMARHGAWELWRLQDDGDWQAVRRKARAC